MGPKTEEQKPPLLFIAKSNVLKRPLAKLPLYSIAFLSSSAIAQSTAKLGTEAASNSDVLTFILVVITAFYAWVTMRILKANQAAVAAMRDQQDAVMRPYIDVSMNVWTGAKVLRLLKIRVRLKPKI